MSDLSELSDESESFPKEESMNEEIRAYLTAMKLEELKSLRPDLVTAIGQETTIPPRARSSFERLQTSATELKTKIKELEKEIETMKADEFSAQLADHKTELLSAIKQDNIRIVARDLLQGDSIAALDANWPKVQEKLKNLTDGLPIITGANGRHNGSNGSNGTSGVLNQF